ncbi:uncharacterized protein LOC122854986 [Aphidius gifuensis]|uniref:uncharacterized protein LOC122854986 n=1 Tax=Aphidius gifuensis TaxID=684658 RepID=UPI001CDCD42C|nr:uncharacterized protein LOC122854986 [Aphidius gifuensis]
MDFFDVTNRHQLYSLELTLSYLQLQHENFNHYNKDLMNIKIKFLTLPIFEITASKLKLEKSRNSSLTNSSLILSSSISCLFSERSDFLVQKMQTTTVCIGIFLNDDKYPIAQKILLLSGCPCYQNLIKINNQPNSPEPYLFIRNYSINDLGKNRVGFIHLELKITCLGQYEITGYQIEKYCLVIESDCDEGQYIVKPREDE